MDAIDEALELAKRGAWTKANMLLDGFGVEWISCAGRELMYINLGDTYMETVCAEDGECWRGSWGDWYEEAENECCEQ